MTGAALDDRAVVLAIVDLEALWAELVGPRARGGGWPCPNPQHAQSGATPPVSITPDAGLWCCHGCGAAGSAVDLLVILGATVADAMTELRRRAGMERRPGARPTGTRRVPPPQPPARVAVLDPSAGAIVGPPSERAMAEYLAARQWRPEAAAAFGLGVVADGRGQLRIRHPYRSGAECIWYQDRAVADGVQPRWLSPKGHPRVPFALDLAAALDGPVVVVVEGPSDVVAAWHAATAAPVVGLPGTAGVSRWGAMLAGLDVLALLDADPAGDRAAAELASAVTAHGGRCARVRPPDGLDVDDWRRQVGDEGLADAIIAAADAADWTEATAGQGTAA